MKTPSRTAAPPHTGFTLVELLVVILIVSIIAAVTLPVVIPAISHRQVSETARIIQGGLIAARDSALRTRSPHGIRFLPDPIYNGKEAGGIGQVDPFRILASNRFIPIEQPPGYSDGKVFLDVIWDYERSFVNIPNLANNESSANLYPGRRVMMIVQASYTPIPGTIPTDYLMETPTSWFWNIRAGDRIQINNVGPFFTVVGPMDIDNPEKFVNVSAPALQLTDPDGANYHPEFLFVVNGVDDDKDGYIDNGWDGVDNDCDGRIDNLEEWSETEKWPSAFLSSSSNIGGSFFDGVPYTIFRRPVPSPGARETVLPSNVVVDLTSSLLPTSERSRLPVDPLSGNVDVLVEPSGRVVPTTLYSSPSSSGLTSAFYHIWVAERSDLHEVQTTGTGTATTAAPLIDGKPFLLPMPLGRNIEATGPNAYDDLVGVNPTLPYLKGEMRLLTLSAKTGNLLTTDRPLFNLDNVNQPYHAPQLGEQGDTP